MTDNNHPITPSPELVEKWRSQAPTARDAGVTRERHIANQAARWGADQELEACCEWLSNRSSLTEKLRDVRRPPAIPETVEVDGHTYRLVK